MADNAKLKSLLLQAKDNVFAVLDGAQFDDLPMALSDGGFRHRSLYLDVGIASADQVRTSPQLVCLHQQNEDATKDSTAIDPTLLDRLLNLIGERPAVVFWQCDAGADVLYRHLRGINKILYPRNSHIESGHFQEEVVRDEKRAQTNPTSHELVIFRHADANVMAQVLPSLTAENWSRILGPSLQILCRPDSDWAKSSLRLQRDANMPAAPLGTLKLSIAEVYKIEDRREAKACQTVGSYLRQYASDATKQLSDDELTERVRKYRNEAKRYGIRSEAAHHRWAYLQIVSGGRIAENADFNRFMRHSNPSVSADNRIGLLMKATTAHLRRAH